MPARRASPRKASRSPQRRKTAGLIVDVANVVHEDLRGQHVMLVSTGKTLRYRLANPETLPSVREGTEWLVLDVPSSNAVTGKRSGRRRSPVRLIYSQRKHGKSQCYISSGRTRTRTSHRWCEVDDRVIAALAKKHKMKIYSNDRELSSGRTSPNLKDFRELLEHTDVYRWRFKRGRWVHDGAYH